ncbi:MAG: hypothetical protein ACTS3R_09585 [Inquilinaceae bacterium]
MVFELIAVIVAGFAAAGVVLMVNHLTGGRLPRWLTPVGAGAAMLAMTIYSEYAWFDRTRSALPGDVVVARTVEDRAVYRPWTYAVPYVDRFIAVDRASIRRNDAAPGQIMVDLLVFGRWAPVRRVPVLMDCDTPRRADLVDEVQFDADGRVTNADWRALDSDDQVFRTVCEP